MLDNGNVKAFGALEKVWGSSAMRPAAGGRAQQRAARAGAGAASGLPMTALSLGDQHIWVSRVNQPVKSVLRIRIASADVSLALQPPQNTSIRNILPAQVVELLELDDRSK